MLLVDIERAKRDFGLELKHAYSPTVYYSALGLDHFVVKPGHKIAVGEIRRKPGDALCKKKKWFAALVPTRKKKQMFCFAKGARKLLKGFSIEKVKI